MDNTSKKILVIFLMVLVFYLLSVLSSLLIPLVFAFLFAVLFQPLVNMMKKIKAPNWLIMPVVVAITLGILFGLFNIIMESSSQISGQKEYLMHRLDYKITTLFQWISSISGLTLNSGNIINELDGIITTQWISSTAGGIAQSLGSFTGSFIMFSLYYVVLLAGLANYEKYLAFVGKDKGKEFIYNYKQIQKKIFNYIIIKTLTSLTTGFIVFLLCLAFGVKFAILWGFMTFLLNYIPSIGSILALLLPALMAFIQFDSIQIILFFLLCIGVVQFLVGNVIEPKIMGNQLNLNTLTVIFGLVFWGYLWGISGMILSVPLLVIIKLIFEHTKSMSIVARIMSSPTIE